MTTFKIVLLAIYAGLSLPALAESLRFLDELGHPVGRVMVTRSPADAPVADTSDDGYAPDGISNRSSMTTTRFTNDAGNVRFNDAAGRFRYRARAQGYRDIYFDETARPIVLQRMNAPDLPDSYPSNVWLSQVSFGGDDALKKRFQLNCAFCHQQASVFMRNERSIGEWLQVFERMNAYGARLPEDDFEHLAGILQREYRRLRDNSSTVPAPRRWDAYLTDIELTEWPIGDGFSQMHDFLLHPNGLVYVGDNLFDRIYEVDPANGKYTVYKVPHPEGAGVGGFLGNRFTTFPKVGNYMGAHSFAYSAKDGNIFITPSMQQALLEFNPRTRQFTTHWMDEGYYPHTIRIDQQDRVWFTLALSSQVAMFDRASSEFKLYDLPARSFKEWLVLKSLPLIFWFDPENRPQPSPDREGSGLPMPYGIDISPDGTVWVARLYANDIARIDPNSGEVAMIEFPFHGPRRLRVDADNKVWIVAFQDSLLVRYDPETEQFSSYDLPVVNELPYALNVDRRRGIVWVNGNQSDTLLSFDIATETWKVYPMPRRRFFTRDVEIDERDGAAYTTNSHFPTWQSEGGVPTLLRISPVAAE